MQEVEQRRSSCREYTELKKSKIYLAQRRQGKPLKIFATERTENILLSLSVYFGVRHYFMWDVNKDIVVLRELCGKDLQGFTLAPLRLCAR